MAAFYLDNDVASRFEAALVQEGHDVYTVRQRGTRKHPDAYHLLTATQEHRILVTHNGEHFVLLHQAWRLWSAAWGNGPAHGGILILPQQRISAPLLARAWITRLLNSGRPFGGRCYEHTGGDRWVEVA